MRRSAGWAHWVLAALAVAAVAGCGAASQYGAGDTAGEQPGRMASCSTKGGHDIGLEPPYSAGYLHRWQTADGCPVRLDYLMTRSGEGSCGGTRAADLLIGWPLGTSSDGKGYRIYVRDPENVFHDEAVSAA